MSASDSSDKEPDTSGPSLPRRDLRLAWMWVVLVPVGFAVAMLVGEGAIGLLGYPAGGDQVAPLGIAALAAGPATLIGLFPGAMAVLHGRRARRAGLPRGLVPAVIGALVLLSWVFVTVAGLTART